MWCPCMQDIFFWGDHGSLIDVLFMMVIPIDILLYLMKKPLLLYLYPQDKCIWWSNVVEKKEWLENWRVRVQNQEGLKLKTKRKKEWKKKFQFVRKQKRENK